MEASEEVMDIIGDCMTKAEAWSHDIAAITVKIITPTPQRQCGGLLHDIWREN